MSRRFVSYVCLATALLTLPVPPANAQLAGVQGPVAGFVSSSASKTIRPLLGVPGATHLDPPLLSQLDAASIAPGGKWAFIQRAGQALFVRGLADLAPAEAAIAGLIDAVDRVVWSRDGSVAVLYSSAGSQLQRVRLSGAEPILDTPVLDTPVVDTPVDLATWGRVTALAVDASGRQIAAGFAGAGLYLFAAGQSPALLSSMPETAAVAFDNSGGRVYAIDPGRQLISEFASGAGASDFAPLAQPDAPPVTPVGLALSGDGRYLMVADSASHSVLVYETGSDSLCNTIHLDFAPSRLEALSASPAFLLNGNDPKEWLLVLDASQVPAVYFVPASAEELR